MVEFRVPLHETGSEIVKKGPSQRMYGVKILYGDETSKLKVGDQQQISSRKNSISEGNRSLKIYFHFIVTCSHILLYKYVFNFQDKGKFLQMQDSCKTGFSQGKK